MIAETKARLRAEAEGRRSAIATAKRVVSSADILGRLFELTAVSGASWIHFYVSIGAEVETTGMIAHALMKKKRVVVPRVDSAEKRLDLYEIASPVRDLAPGFRGIPEPNPEGRTAVPASTVELFVIPGVAYDAAGRRLGRGGGYYDRLLAAARLERIVIAPAFDCQIVESVPAERHDLRVDFIVTEKRLIDCRGNDVRN